jgi:hypothetical protein
MIGMRIHGISCKGGKMAKDKGKDKGNKKKPKKDKLIVK